MEIPWFQEFETKFGRRHFAVIGVSLDEQGWDAVKPYAGKAKVTYRMVLADDSILKHYSVTSLPATFLIDREGRIAAAYTGLVDRENIESNISAVLRRR